MFMSLSGSGRYSCSASIAANVSPNPRNTDLSSQCGSRRYPIVFFFTTH
ncbi:cytochrome c oxidase assembly protein cox11 [Moniliophthora roreri]|nr:cytochrome c oxidase assembly protein cox11 [Moniliophthora roreri]